MILTDVYNNLYHLKIEKASTGLGSLVQNV